MSKKCLQINKTIHLFLLNRANSFFVLIPMLLLSSFFIIASIILPIYYIDEWPISLAVCLFFLALAIFALSGQFVGLHICPDGKVYVVPNILIKRFKWSEIEKIYISFNEFVQDSHFARIEIYLKSGKKYISDNLFEYRSWLNSSRLIGRIVKLYAISMQRIQKFKEHVKHLGKFQITVTDIYHNERVLLPFGGVDGEEEEFGEVTPVETSTEESTTDTNGEKKGIRVATAAKEEYYIDDIEETFSDKLLKIINYFAVAASIVRRVTSPGITGLPDLIFTIVCIAYIAFYIPYSLIRLNRRIRAKRLYESERLARTLLEEEQEESNEQEK